MTVLALFALALLTGSLVYCVIAFVGARRYRESGAARLSVFPPVSVLRPLHGADDDTEANLRCLFGQSYSGEFEVLLSVHEISDPAVEVARKVMAEYPNVPSRLIVSGPSPLPNAKVWSLRALEPEARHQMLVMTDSDIRLEPNALETLASELEQTNVALVTCPYRAVPGRGFWARLEALGLNTEFFGGMLAARLLNGMDFAIGCTIATRKADLGAIGGLEHLQRYLAEDFMMGSLTRQRGKTVVLSRSVIAHSIGGHTFRSCWRHRLRWVRSTRRSRPLGYVGELFTRTYALSLALLLVAPRLWPVTVFGIALRLAIDWNIAVRALGDPLVRRYWWLLPVEGVASFVSWSLGFFGKTIDWRGRKLVVQRDGSFETTS